ncbi:MAG: PQQ-binding-like beta-propeller repeat protein [Polyangiales bacterium]
MKLCSLRNLASSLSAGAIALSAGCEPPGQDAPHESARAPGEAAQVTEPTRESAWTMLGYDLGSTYYNSAETALTKESAARLEVSWQADLGDNVYAPPLQVGDKVYASSGVVVQAFEAATGKSLWRNTTAGTTASLFYDEGTLYAHVNNGNITAIDASTGQTKWSKPSSTQGPTDGSSSPLVIGNLVLIGGSNGALEMVGGGRFRGYMGALDKQTGAPAWTAYTVPTGAKGASIWSSPAVDVAAGRVFGTTGNNYGAPATDTSDAFVAFDLKTGAILWKNQRTKNDTWGPVSAGPDFDFGANPVLYEADVKGVKTQLVSSAQKSGDAHAVRRDTGELVWTRSLGAGTRTGTLGVFVNGTWSGKNMLFACNKDAGNTAELFALNGGTGAIAWQRKLTGPVWGRISVANGVGFVGVGNKLEVFDVDTGAVIKTFPSKKGTVAGTPSVANGRVAFGEGMAWANARPGSTLTVLTVK